MYLPNHDFRNLMHSRVIGKLKGRAVYRFSIGAYCPVTLTMRTFEITESNKKRAMDYVASEVIAATFEGETARPSEEKFGASGFMLRCEETATAPRGEPKVRRTEREVTVGRIAFEAARRAFKAHEHANKGTLIA